MKKKNTTTAQRKAMRTTCAVFIICKKTPRIGAYPSKFEEWFGSWGLVKLSLHEIE